MKQVIDNLDDMTGWVVNSPSVISENEFKDYIAGLNNKSLLIKFDENDSIKTATKTFSSPIDVANYDTLVFSVWSKNKGKQIYNKANDFNYKIKINSTDEYYMQIYETMSDISIGIEEITEITQIQITALHEEEDYIIISEMIAEKEEPAYDILYAVKEHIDYYIDDQYGDGISIATGITATIGNKYIDLNDNPFFIGRYTVVKLKEGATEEIHQIQDNDGSRFYFNSNYDGKIIQNTFTSAVVYITFPCYFNHSQLEIRLPGIAIWGITPETKLTDAKLYTKIDTYNVNNDNFKGRQIGQILVYTILIDMESYSIELLEKMSQVVRNFIARESLWINGRRHDIFFSSIATEQKPALGFDIIPKIQYSLTVEIRENINDRVTMPKTSVIDLQVNINNN
jgi:hypothetical protein